ncbi:MAG: hypothetical protein ABJH07_08405 [Sedimentitalea sp.]|uniref:tetratricopeptide repeat protein n=1 Tax=Sedimentitalea sp. TaxID=2048915 RepID=UPI0032642B60
MADVVLEQARDVSETPSYFSQRARVLHGMGRTAEAISTLNNAIKHYQENSIRFSEVDRAFLIGRLATYLRFSGSPDAEMTFLQAWSLVQGKEAEEPILFAEVASDYGGYLHEIGDLGGSRAIYVEAVGVLSENGLQGQIYSELQSNLAFSYFASGQSNEAREHIKDAISSYAVLVGKAGLDYSFSTSFALWHQLYSAILVEAGEHSAAIDSFEVGMSINEVAFGNEHQRWARYLYVRALHHTKAGEYSQAEENLELSISILQSRDNISDLPLTRAMVFTAINLAVSGQPIQAREALQKIESQLNAGLLDRNFFDRFYKSVAIALTSQIHDAGRHAESLSFLSSVLEKDNITASYKQLALFVLGKYNNDQSGISERFCELKRYEIVLEDDIMRRNSAISNIYALLRDEC